MEPSLGTLAGNLGTSWNIYAEPLLGTLEYTETLYLYLEPPSGTFTGNSYWEPRNLLEPLLYLEPFPGTWEPLLGTLRASFRNLHLEPLPGTSEPRGTLQDDCPRVPQGLVWLRPQSFQLLGKKIAVIMIITIIIVIIILPKITALLKPDPVVFAGLWRGFFATRTIEAQDLISRTPRGVRLKYVLLLMPLTDFKGIQSIQLCF